MSALKLMFTGDLVLDEPNPDYWLAGLAPALRTADVVVGHLETPHTRSCGELAADVPAPGADPAHLAALVRAGFTGVTLAGNHIADCGPQGIADTIRELERLGLAHTGAGLNLTQARAPAILAKGAIRTAVLSYNCVGPEAGWAAADRAGCSYIYVAPADGGPATPSAQLERIDPDSLADMVRDIEQAHTRADVVVVAFHKGVVHTRARLAPYERPLAHAAVEAGADIVVGHHAHIVRGIEIHRGKPIFHGLGNGCVVTRALSLDQSHPVRAAWARKRRELFGFDPDPAYPLAPFHPEAVNAFIGAVCLGKRMRIGFTAMHVEPPGRPVLADAAQTRRIANYVADITREAGLPSLQLEFDDEGVWLS
jgi:poly-gamma-glutamate capsule biosynthesis protein CapA/YwtB (metallophosphatase superfamily)